MKPIIKWPGGKSRDIKKIRDRIPDFDRYIEPFAGGAALFFELEPKNAIINDLSNDLISFYRILKSQEDREKFKEEVYRYSDNWNKINTYIEVFGETIIHSYTAYKNEETTYSVFNFEINSILEDKIAKFNGLFEEEFCIDRKNLLHQIKKNLTRKLKQTNERVDKDKTFSDEELKEHIEAAFRSGFFMHFRDLMNGIALEKNEMTEVKRMANYYFVREFCYGAMFRFNENGHFNIPYGGILYNKKNWRKKLDEVFSNDLEEIFNGTKILNLDFREFFDKVELNENDFMFLDPPYYSKFSEYDKNSFGENEQRKLAKILIKTKAKFIMVIQSDPLILEIYNHKKIKISSFEKIYTYNVRGRNPRKTNYLVISNF